MSLAEAVAPAHTRALRAVEDIGLRTAPRWIRRTIAQDRRFSARGPRVHRPLTPSRIFASIHPRLDRPIFIVGAPRSGTTFLGECIGALPGVSYHFEPVATKAAGRHVYERRWSERTSRFVFREVYRLLLRLHADGDLRLAEKTPQNCFLISFLARTFRDAAFVHIIRDGRDAALSYSRKPWLLARSAGTGAREAGGHLNGPYARYWVEPERRAEFESTTDFHRCVWAWRLHTESALQQLAALRPGDCHEVRYEALVGQPREEGRRLLSFLGMTGAEHAQRFDTAVAGVTARSVGGWRRELGEAELRTTEQEAGSLLRRLGYA